MFLHMSWGGGGGGGGESHVERKSGKSVRKTRLGEETNVEEVEEERENPERDIPPWRETAAAEGGRERQPITNAHTHTHTPPLSPRRR